MSDARAELEAIDIELAGVERALSGLDDGSYGTCELCGGPVDAEADVLAVRCPVHT